MKLPAWLDTARTRFEKLSQRERLLVLVAVFAAVFVLWDSTLMSPLDARRDALTQELATLQEGMNASAESAEAAASTDPVTVAFLRSRTLQTDLSATDARLASETSGLIEPRHMAEVIHDVLHRQQGVVLVSLRNLPARSLAKDPSQTTGPYLHPVELVVEGSYLDVLAYLRALEALPWRFYWRLLELQTTEYPVNRVRIELGTLSMDREWIGF